MRVDVFKDEKLTLARHGKILVSVGFDGSRVLKEAIDYIGWYQGKWYRKLKLLLTRLLLKVRFNDVISFGEGTFSMVNIEPGDHIELRGQGNAAELRRLD